MTKNDALPLKTAGGVLLNPEEEKGNEVSRQPEEQNAYRDPAQSCRPYQDPAKPYLRDSWQPYGPYQNPAQPGWPEFPPEQQRKGARRRLRRAGNRASLMPILVTVFQFVAAILVFAVWARLNSGTLQPVFRAGGLSGLAKYIMAQKNTLIFLSILSVILAMVISVLVARPMLRQKIFGAWKRPSWTGSGFAKRLVLLFGVAGVAELLVLGLDSLCRATGWKLSAPDVSLSGNPASNAVLIAYVCVLAPLLEETLFRGMILGSLRPWGDRFAVVVSALMFGLTHMNLYQGVPAFLLGLLLGFTAVKFGSVVPTVLMHILYNSLSMTMLAAGMETNQALQTGYVFFLALAAAGSIVLLVRRRVDFGGAAPQTSPSAPAEEHPYRVALFQSPAFWVLLVCFALLSVVAAGALVSPSV